MPEVSTQITQLIFLALLVIPSLITLGGVLYASLVVVPALLKQGQQLIDNNTQLTKVTETTEKALVSITPELVNQTNAINAQTNKIEVTNTEIQGQRIDLKNYNALVIDTVANHATHLETNTAMMAKFEASMVRFETIMNDLPEQIQIMIEDRFKCDDVLNSFRALESYVKQIVFQQQRKTGSFPVVPTSTPTEKPSTS